MSEFIWSMVYMACPLAAWTAVTVWATRWHDRRRRSVEVEVKLSCVNKFSDSVDRARQELAEFDERLRGGKGRSMVGYRGAQKP